VTKYDIQSSCIYKNKILILKTASELSFFSLVRDEVDKEIRWKRFHFDIIRGQIFHIEGTDDFQLVTEKLIYFYKFPENEDQEVIKPDIDMVMYNFMKCNELMIDPE
jgi:hypothetical protein